MADAHSTAQRRRRIVIDALSRELSTDADSSTTKLAARLDQARPLVVSADIDGLVSATMLASVARNFEIVAFLQKSATWLVHPGVADDVPANAIAVDLFSPDHDSISNHVILWGARNIKAAGLRDAFVKWDEHISVMGKNHLQAAPSIWAGTQGGYEAADRPDSARYKYPLGTAQILLAMLEVADRAPKFFDRTYLPWLVANCDGGVSTFSKYADNARVWWPVMAGAVGPGSLTEQLYELVSHARPHDFRDAVHQLERERRSANEPTFLKDDWTLSSTGTTSIADALTWLTELTGWRDPVRGGIAGLDKWISLKVSSSGLVPYSKPNSLGAGAAQSIGSAHHALNANFYHGGRDGSRFNWVGGWV